MLKYLIGIGRNSSSEFYHFSGRDRRWQHLLWIIRDNTLLEG